MRQARPPQCDRLVQLIYGSTATCPFIEDEFEAFLENARETNFKNHISSVIIYQNGAFNQVLEGPEHAVSQIFERIKADPRHRDIALELYCYVPVREYNDGPLMFLHMQGHARENPSPSLLEYADQVLQTISEDVSLARSS